jgi:hypothetical protein
MITPRRYDKGERRYKHVGRGDQPTIEFDDSQPRKWVGKCPATFNEAALNRLLNQAIPARNGDRDLLPPKRLYVVHEGAIYEAQTSDGGNSYHGYPFRGKVSRALFTRLQTMAGEKNCLDAFRAWVRKYVLVYGDRT